MSTLRLANGSDRRLILLALVVSGGGVSGWE